VSAIDDIKRELAAHNCPNRNLRLRIGISAGQALLAGLRLKDQAHGYRWPSHMPLRFEDALVETTDRFPGWQVEPI
jgi:hypothetical protein